MLKRAFLLIACMALILAGATAAVAAARTTVFTGRIVAATGIYSHLRGTVHVRLTSSGATATPTATSASFRLVLSGALTGRLTGTARGVRPNPDIGASFGLTGSGLVGRLGRVDLTGSTTGVGFIAHARFPLTVHLHRAAGGVTIKAQSAPVAGFSSPF